MIHCSAMTFDRLFLHVSSHQDDREDYDNLSRQAQLNCAANFGIKRVLLRLNPDNLPMKQTFPLEAISVWAGREKMTSDTGSSIRYHVHKNLTREDLTWLGYCHFNSLFK